MMNMDNNYINIYNIFLRSVKDKKALQLSIERAKYMGFDTIYFNPFFKTGKSKSIYSISNYYKFDELSFDSSPELVLQVKDIIKICNKNSIRPIIDLVINHTAIDSNLLKSNPNFYYYEGGKVKIASGRNVEQDIKWYDLAQLDYSHIDSGLWEYMLRLCKYYIDLGFRGFRCDAADQVPSNFWAWLILKIRSIDSGVIFIGEAFLCSLSTRKNLATAGFNYIYNSAKWWDYKSDWLLNEYNAICKYIHSISFPDNHDTRRLMDELGGNINLFLLHLYFTAFWSEGFEITRGTEFGESSQLDCVTTRRFQQEKKQYDFTEHIKEILRIRRLLFKNYKNNDPQQILCKGDSVEILKKFCSVKIKLHTSEVIVTKSLNDFYNIYLFNCIDPKPIIKKFYF